jgi:hypothetical protein
MADGKVKLIKANDGLLKLLGRDSKVVSPAEKLFWMEICYPRIQQAAKEIEQQKQGCAA